MMVRQYRSQCAHVVYTLTIAACMLDPTHELDDHDLRIPFIIRGPGVPRGVKSEAIVLNIDIAPTISAIATGSVPPNMDGRNILETFTPTMATPWRSDFMVPWRSDFMVQYKGQYREPCLLQQCPPPPKDNFHIIDGINNTCVFCVFRAYVIPCHACVAHLWHPSSLMIFHTSLS